MTDIADLQAKELESLNEEDEEIFDLESLITDGVDARIPIVVEVPKDGEIVKAAALIRPLTTVEWNNAIRFNRKSLTTNNEIELVKKGLYTKSGKPFPPELIEEMPAGVVMKLFEKIAEVSGIELYNEKTLKFAGKMAGFSI